MASPSMDDIADEYAARGVGSIFLYVREAHPGEYYPHHDSFQRKLVHAREFKRIFGTHRSILVDDLEGTAHREFGGLPNMTYIVNRANSIVYRSDWTDAPTIRFALEYILGAMDQRRQGAKIAPFYAEIMGFRERDDADFDKRLERNGPKAVTEMQNAREMWARGEHIYGVNRRNRQS